MAETLIGTGTQHTERAVGGTTVVELHGDLDIRAALSLRACLDELTDAVRPDLVVDLSEVSFVDCAGLGPLCRARRRALERHGRLRLVTDDDRILRLLRGTGLKDVFELCDHLPEPLAGVAASELSAAAS